MTKVQINTRQPSQNGLVIGVGEYRWTPTSRQIGVDPDGGQEVVILPVTFSAPVNGGSTLVDVTPTNQNWCWQVNEMVSGGITRYVDVPDSISTVQYTDLVDVDPKSLQPTAVLQPAWQSFNDTINAGLIQDTTSATAAALNATYARSTVFDPRNYGTVDLTGITDSSAAILATIAAAQANGGTIQLPQGTIRCDSQLAFAVGTGGKQKSVRITGTGRSTNWDSGNGNGGTILDLRYSGANAKITTYAQGVLEIDHLTLTDLGTSPTPFLLTTGTTVHAHDIAVIGNPSKNRTTCDQDAFILGGTTTATTNSGPTDAFQGYGTVIERVLFDRVRRGVYIRTYANSVVVRDNSFSNRCGSAGNEGAIEIDPGTATGSPNAFASGCLITGNLIEVYGYKYGMRLLNKAYLNVIQGNSFWDFQAGYLGDIYFDATANSNTVNSSGVQTSGQHLIDTNGTNIYMGSLATALGNQATLTVGNAGGWVHGGGGLTFDNNASAINQLDSGGVKRTIITLGSSNTLYMGDANAAMSNQSVIVRCGATGSIIRLRAGGTDQMQISTTGIGFYGSSPVARPVLNYSRTGAGETAAGAAIRGALASLGLITDSTTA